ncbi:MAG: MarR family transcriptional regulator [Candidatus Woesearchaeota archaeon]
MKVKKIILKKGNLDEFFRNVEKAVKKPIKKTEAPVLYIEDINEFKKILTEERIRILRVIKHKNPQSVYELAKMLKRDRSNVITDLALLENLGFIELDQEKNIRTVMKPKADYDRIDISVEI